VLYVVESRATPSRRIWAWDLTDGGTLSNKRLHIDADGAGALDGIAVDALGNVWCGYGSDGRGGAPSEGLDGVRVFNRDGRPIGHVHLPERCANLCFGGANRNRLFMAASHSLYALYVNVQGAA
jgi:gluconolactonase